MFRFPKLPNPAAAIWRALMAADPVRVKVWAQVGAAMALTMVMVGYGLVIWKGPWLPEHQKTQLDWIGWGMVLAAGLVLVALAAITGLNVNLDAGRNGIRATIDQDDAQPLPTLKFRGEAELTPAEPPGATSDPDALPENERVKL